MRKFGNLKLRLLEKVTPPRAGGLGGCRAIDSKIHAIQTTHFSIIAQETLFYANHEKNAHINRNKISHINKRNKRVKTIINFKHALALLLDHNAATNLFIIRIVNHKGSITHLYSWIEIKMYDVPIKKHSWYCRSIYYSEFRIATAAATFKTIPTWTCVRAPYGARLKLVLINLLN